jgi:hypothetical protein
MAIHLIIFFRLDQGLLNAVFTFSNYNFKSLYALVSAASSLRIGQSGVQISVGERDFSKNAQTDS